jgi:hypothetical protein
MRDTLYLALPLLLIVRKNILSREARSGVCFSELPELKAPLSLQPLTPVIAWNLVGRGSSRRVLGSLDRRRSLLVTTKRRASHVDNGSSGTGWQTQMLVGRRGFNGGLWETGLVRILHLGSWCAARALIATREMALLSQPHTSIASFLLFQRLSFRTCRRCGELCRRTKGCNCNNGYRQLSVPQRRASCALLRVAVPSTPRLLQLRYRSTSPPQVASHCAAFERQ